MITAIVKTTVTDIGKIQTSTNKVLGYPKQGLDIGKGLHVKASASVTINHQMISKHPTLAQWMQPADASVVAVLTSIANDAGISASTSSIDEKVWFPTKTQP